MLVNPGVGRALKGIPVSRDWLVAHVYKILFLVSPVNASYTSLSAYRYSRYPIFGE